MSETSPHRDAAPHGHYHALPPMKHDFLTPVYDLGCRLLGLGPRFRDSIIGALELTGSESVLDAGCGTGVLAARIKEKVPSITMTGLDPTPSALRIAARRAEKKNLAVEWKEGFAESMPFTDAAFDRVVTSLAFHHIPPDKKIPALRECLRVLKPGGRLLLVDFCELDTVGARVFLKLIIGVEHFGGQIGKLGEFLGDAGFTGVRLVHRAHLGIGFYLGEKTVLGVHPHPNPPPSPPPLRSGDGEMKKYQGSAPRGRENSSPSPLAGEGGGEGVERIQTVESETKGG